MKLATGCAALFAAMTLCTPALAVPIVENSGWQNFLTGDVGSALNFGGGDTTLTFTLANFGLLRFQDALIEGDRWNIVINSIDQGPTSLPITPGPFAADYDVAATQSNYSRASYLLGPGSYVVTGTAIQLPPSFTIGSGGVRLDSALAPVVPELNSATAAAPFAIMALILVIAGQNRRRTA